MPKLYESYADDENVKKMMKCIKEYLNGNETQIYYCKKHDVKLSAFKRYWAKYKDKNHDNLKEMKERLLNKNSDKDHKLPKYDTSSDNKVFKKPKKQDDIRQSENIKIHKTHNGGANNDDTNQKYERTGSKNTMLDPKKFFNLDGLMAKEDVNY